MSGSSPMPRYTCHKEVSALKILGVAPMSPEGSVELFVEPPFAPIPVTDEWFHKYEPSVGGYYVVHKDGYTSYSPAAAFEEGYTRV